MIRLREKATGEEAEWTWETGWVGPATVVGTLDILMRMKRLDGGLYDTVASRQRLIAERIASPDPGEWGFEVVAQTPPPELRGNCLEMRDDRPREAGRDRGGSRG